MGRLEDVIDALKTAITTALQNANVTPAGKVMRGWPEEKDLRAIRTGGSPIVAIVPLDGARKTSRWRPKRVGNGTGPMSIPLTATVSHNELTFSGSVVPGLNVHTFLGRPAVDVPYQTVQGDNPASVALAVTALIQAAAIPGVSASVSTETVTTTTPYLKCNIGGSTTALLEIGRVDQRMQVTIWTKDSNDRGAISGTIESNIGTPLVPFIAVGDGTKLWTRYAYGPRWRNESIGDAMLKRADFGFDVEYGILLSETLTQVVGFQVSATPGATTDVG